MFCTNCGNALPDNVNFCPFCGARLADQIVTSSPDPVPEAETSVQDIPAAEEAAPVMDETAPFAEEAASATEDSVCAVEEEMTSVAEEAVYPVNETAEAAEAAAEESFSEVQEAIGTASDVPAVDETPTWESAYTYIPAPAAPEAYSPPVSAPEAQDPVPENTDTGAPAPQMPAPAPIAPAKGTKKKSGKAVLIAMAALIALCAIGFAVWSNLPGTKYSKHVKAAQEAYAANDYVAAYQEYTEALGYKPDGEEAATAITQLRKEVSDSFYDKLSMSAFSAAERDAATLEQISGDSTDLIGQVWYDLYSAEALDAAGKEDIEGARSIVMEGVDKGRLNDDDAADLLDVLNRMDVRQKYVSTIQDYADSFYNVGKANIYTTIFDAMKATWNTRNTYLDAGGTFPIVLNVSDTTDKVVFYADGTDMMLYLGGITGSNKREGTDTTCYYISDCGTDDAYYYYYICDWTDDAPTGDGLMAEVGRTYGNEEGDSVIYINCPLGILGRFDGDAMIIWRDGEKYFASYKDGYLQLLDTVDPNGDPNNVGAYNADKSSWLNFGEGMFNTRSGLPYIFSE